MLALATCLHTAAGRMHLMTHPPGVEVWITAVTEEEAHRAGWGSGQPSGGFSSLTGSDPAGDIVHRGNS